MMSLELGQEEILNINISRDFIQILGFTKRSLDNFLEELRVSGNF
jgi:hypothetical protein